MEQKEENKNRKSAQSTRNKDKRRSDNKVERNTSQ